MTHEDVTGMAIKPSSETVEVVQTVWMVFHTVHISRILVSKTSTPLCRIKSIWGFLLHLQTAVLGPIILHSPQVVNAQMCGMSLKLNLFGRVPFGQK